MDENSSRLIVLVDDHELNRDMLSRRLERRHFEVRSAGTAEEAMVLIAECRPDLVLMDMSLPGMNGWEATTLLKKDPATAQIPVIGLSAHAHREDRLRGLEAGCDDYDTKPVEFQRLLDKIQQILGA